MAALLPINRLALMLSLRLFTCHSYLHSPLVRRFFPPTEACIEPSEPSVCRKSVFKWRFVVSTKACEYYLWGLCDGSQNRFDSEIECLYYCVGEPCKNCPHKSHK